MEQIPGLKNAGLHFPTCCFSFHFNGHFPGKSWLAGFIGAKGDGDAGDNWSCKMCKAAKSNRHHQQINTQQFTRRMPFLSPNQQCQSTEGKSIILHGLAHPKLQPAVWSIVFQLCIFCLLPVECAMISWWCHGVTTGPLLCAVCRRCQRWQRTVGRCTRRSLRGWVDSRTVAVSVFTARLDSPHRLGCDIRVVDCLTVGEITASKWSKLTVFLTVWYYCSNTYICSSLVDLISCTVFVLTISIILLMFQVLHTASVVFYFSCCSCFL